MEEELKRYLHILIENDLAFKLQLLTEGTNIPRSKIDDEQQKEIINFINGLPKEYRELPERDKIIINKLQRMGIKTKWAEKKTEEIEMTEKMKQVNKIKINHKEMEK